MSIKTLESIDRFDLEQDIMNCWQIKEDLDTFLHSYMDGGKPMSEDDVSNVILGLSALYQLKFEKLWNTFEQCIKNNQFDYDDRLKRIDFLNKEIQTLTNRVAEHDTGHIITAIGVLKDRVKEENSWVVQNY